MRFAPRDHNWRQMEHHFNQTCALSEERTCSRHSISIAGAERRKVPYLRPVWFETLESNMSQNSSVARPVAIFGVQAAGMERFRARKPLHQMKLARWGRASEDSLSKGCESSADDFSQACATPHHRVALITQLSGWAADARYTRCSA